MLKKIVLLAVLAMGMVSSIAGTGSNPQVPIPGCLPCGDGN